MIHYVECTVAIHGLTAETVEEIRARIESAVRAALGVVHQREVCDFLHEMAEQFGMPFVAYPSHGTDATFREME